MPAVTSLSVYGAMRFSRALVALGGRLARRLRQVARSVRNRRDADKLVRLDDRMLADIGLTRFDVRDAYAEPLWRDPTDALAHRAAERRRGRHRSLDPSVAAGFCRPPLDRPVRQLF